MYCPPASRPPPAADAPAPTSPRSNEHRRALEKLFWRLSAATPLPATAQQILMIAADRSSSVEDMRAAIQQDPALAANVLRRINSSYFGLSHKVADLHTAINLLGFREIRNIALTIFVSRMFDRPGAYRRYSRDHLWRHCAAVSVAARKVARVSDAVPPDEAYVAGLLHHTGTILLDQHLRSHFCRVIETLDEKTPTFTVERNVYSFDQAQLSEYVAAQWQFPDCICDAIRYYQYPDQYTGPHRQHLNVLAIANFLCSRAGWTSLGVQNAQPPGDEVYGSLGLSKATVAVLWEELQATLPEATEV